MTLLAKPIEGGCLCGAIRFEAYAEPKWVSVCHCRMCQKAYGQASGVFMGFKKGVLKITRGDPKIYKSSAWGERRFCQSCGSPLGVTYADLDSILVGTLDNPEDWPPKDFHLGIESQIPWNIIHDTLPQWKTEDDPDFNEAIKAIEIQK